MACRLSSFFLTSEISAQEKWHNLPTDLPVACNLLPLAVCHSPLAAYGHGLSLDLEPVLTIHVLDGAVVSREGEELLPELEHSGLLANILLTVWKDQHTAGMAWNMWTSR